MSFWIYLALLAYLINAVTFIIDKYLLALPIPKPFAYAFWVGILSTPVIFLIPFFPIQVVGPTFLILAFLSGAMFFGGLISLYKAIEKTDISVASTQIFTLTPIFTYIFAKLILNEDLPEESALGLVFLVPGIFLLGKLGRGILKYTLIGGLLFGLSFALLKWTFVQSDLISGVLWTRVGLIGAAISTLAIHKYRKEIISSFKKSSSNSKFTLVGNKLLGGIGFITLYIAIDLGNVAIVNALLGFQFLFVFLLALFLRNKIPGIREHLEKNTIIQKILGIIFIITGFLVTIF